jgi:hypothetical protein
MIQGHRRLSGPIDTPDGYPLPLTGRALTKTPVVVKKEGVELKQYSEKNLYPAESAVGWIIRPFLRRFLRHRT